ncbi:CRISPR-associated endoribonuclease Cas6 [Clostridiaceae bacterium UIB06]|uniref:CRISPR-associated endoribonuclease Cas6 n=1 Tax=Clostridium thailandense TaxID=2794346 RepID=A0A949TNS0_9CLOT|nr:CRISPR-associated endoribonuclease Cas6 [Clostridium thailandense]MBV7273827.1 CRISPR-associated endoribonuclease Cas6 [Clostridium thailandense]MCH5136908.1 CRISPR-associated endoribonuclease Cas6 [Clostridiaceae bacterium UIB06]
MKVYEISILVFLLEEIDSNDTFTKISAFIDSGMAKVPELLKLHNQNIYKNYCFNSFYPIEEDKKYKQGKTYTIQLRTLDKNLADFFYTDLVNHFNNSIKALTAKIKVIPKKHIEKIYSITPIILKNEGGYWKGNISLTDFERRLKENLIKKYNLLTDTKINENFQLYTSIEFRNHKPVAINYKGRKILGDKISINISDEKISQELAYMCLGTGILEMNARGAGYVNYKWL